MIAFLQFILKFSFFFFHFFVNCKKEEVDCTGNTDPTSLSRAQSFPIVKWGKHIPVSTRTDSGTQRDSLSSRCSRLSLVLLCLCGSCKTLGSFFGNPIKGNQVEILNAFQANWKRLRKKCLVFHWLRYPYMCINIDFFSIARNYKKYVYFMQSAYVSDYLSMCIYWATSNAKKKTKLFP